MEDNSRKDIRALLKTFGVRADEAIVGHLARNPGVSRLRLKVCLHDLTDYGDHSPDGSLSLEVESDINR
ncbi:MAG: hypothetical protein F4X93_07660 [Proteobacteria bacterium]|nr:hypothetical protein [Pseudomonadota bacterium]MYB89813.1 hypothetical protein [Pseudomonadota bacterium]